MSRDILARQLAEVDALHAIYDDGSFVLDSYDDYQHLQSILEACTSLDEQYYMTLPRLSFQIHFNSSPIDDAMTIPMKKISIYINLPALYPTSAFPTVSVRINGYSRAHHDYLMHMVTEFMETYDDELIFKICTYIKDIVDEIERDAYDSMVEEEYARYVNERVRTSSVELIQYNKLGRRAIWSHHILCSFKRQYIVNWARELEVGGFSKIGYPGIIMVEGRELLVEEFCRRLLRLRWKAIQVRGEEILPGDYSHDRRIFALPLQELGEDGLPFLASTCRDRGAEDLFRSALKLYKKS